MRHRDGSAPQRGSFECGLGSRFGAARVALGCAERANERVDDLIGIGGKQHIDYRQRLMVHAPAIVQRMVLRDLDDPRHRIAFAESSDQRARKVRPVEAQDDVGARDRVAGLGYCIDARSARMQPVIRRKARADLEIGHDLRVERFREADPLLPRGFVTRHAADQDHRSLGTRQQRRHLRNLLGRCRHGDRRHVAANVDRRQRRRQRRFLQAHVEIDVDRSLGRRLRDPSRAQDCFARGGWRGRLVVPLRVVADHRALVACGVDPFDPRAAVRGVDRSRRAYQHQRHPVAPRVEQRHRRMHETDV